MLLSLHFEYKQLKGQEFHLLCAFVMSLVHTADTTLDVYGFSRVLWMRKALHLVEEQTTFEEHPASGLSGRAGQFHSSWNAELPLFFKADQ